MDGAVDVLAEEHSFSGAVKINGNGIRGMAGDEKQMQFFPINFQNHFRLIESSVNQNDFRRQSVPLGRSQDRVLPEQDFSGVFMRDDFQAELVLELVGAPDVVNMAVGENKFFDPLRLKAQLPDIFNNPGNRLAGA